jgi:mono/diheme cytochrome c family protein
MRFVLLVIFVAMAYGGTFATRAINSAPGGAGKVSARSAAALYARNCASCHGRDGRAKTSRGRSKHAKDLADSEWQARVGDERIFNSVMNGKGKMPAYGKILSEQEIDSIVTYVRGLKK